MTRIVIVGPVYPYRAGVAHCTTRLAEELAILDDVTDVRVESFARQYPAALYPGGDDRDPTLVDKAPAEARFDLDILNPLSWLRVGRRIRKRSPDIVILVWWVWVWALPYLVLKRFLPSRSRVILQCHNVTDKEPAWWKSVITNRVLRIGDIALVHARDEGDEVVRRLGERSPRVVRSFLPVHELGGVIPDREIARGELGITHERVALFFGHIRPFKGLDLALRAWSEIDRDDSLLLVVGEPWWGSGDDYREMARELGLGDRVRFEFRFVPDGEVAHYFAAADLVLIPYRREAQSGVALTAFHFGRPVVATAIGGLREIVDEGRNGFLVEEENPAALAAGIRRAFDSDQTVLEAGARASAALYSWERYARELRDLM